jgi:hypothetical protein
MAAVILTCARRTPRTHTNHPTKLHAGTTMKDQISGISPLEVEILRLKNRRAVLAAQQDVYVPGSPNRGFQTHKVSDQGRVVSTAEGVAERSVRLQRRARAAARAAPPPALSPLLHPP